MSNFNARILKDSVSPDGQRLTTMEVTIPRIILSEYNTHRMLSRNSASSRAIPTWKQLVKVLETPYIPTKFGIDQPGMQASRDLSGVSHEAAVANVFLKRDRAIIGALEDLFGARKVRETFGYARLQSIMLGGFSGDDEQVVRTLIQDYRDIQARIKENPEYGEELQREGYLRIHKQTLNRYLEPFLWQTIITSATDWDNLFNLRAHPDAQEDIAIPVRMMRDELRKSTPSLVGWGQWHLPLIQEDELDLVNKDNIEMWKKVSAGRCARVTHLTHDGVRDLDKDISLCESLTKNWHMSPLEHVATPYSGNANTGNFRGWLQFRKEQVSEDVFPG